MKKQTLPTFDNNSSHRRSFPFHIEGRDAILSSVNEITAESEDMVNYQPLVCKAYST